MREGEGEGDGERVREILFMPGKVLVNTVFKRCSIKKFFGV